MRDSTVESAKKFSFLDTGKRGSCTGPCRVPILPFGCDPLHRVGRWQGHRDASTQSPPTPF